MNSDGIGSGASLMFSTHPNIPKSAGGLSVGKTLRLITLWSR